MPQLETLAAGEIPAGIQLAKLGHVGCSRLQHDEELGRVPRLGSAAAQRFEARGSRLWRIVGQPRSIDELQRAGARGETGKLRLEELEEVVGGNALEAELSEVRPQEAVPRRPPGDLLQLAQKQVALFVRNTGVRLVRIDTFQIRA